MRGQRIELIYANSYLHASYSAKSLSPRLDRIKYIIHLKIQVRPGLYWSLLDFSLNVEAEIQILNGFKWLRLSNSMIIVRATFPYHCSLFILKHSDKS